ncbi:hypothetical protein ACHQM5_015807 [Ranunculus cassubicifolius]
MFSFGGLSSPSSYQLSQIHFRHFHPNSVGDWIPRHRSDLYSNIIANRYDHDDYAEYDNHHWKVIIQIIGLEFATEEALFDLYIKTLASVVGSEEEAKKRIYLVSCSWPFGFAAEIDPTTASELEEQPGIDAVAEDYYYDARDKNAEDLPATQFNPVNRNHRLDNMFSYHHLSERNTHWKYDHWLVHIKQRDGEELSEQKIIDFCIGILSEVLGSEKEAEKRIYVIWSKMPLSFGVEIDKETSDMLKARQDVLLVLPDYAQDIKNLFRGILVISPSSTRELTCHYHPRPRNGEHAKIFSKNIRK